MILKATGEIIYRQDGISNAWCKTEATTVEKTRLRLVYIINLLPGEQQVDTEH